MDKITLQKHILENLSIAKIAVAENKSKTTVRYWIKKYGLKTIGHAGRAISDYGTVSHYTCKKCAETKPLSEFYKVLRHGKYKPYTYCRACSKEYTKNYTKRDNLKLECIAYKGNCCKICNYDKYFGALEFHHVDPSKKEYSISDKIRLSGTSLEELKPELDKCVLLCSNCHREVHGNVAKLD